MQPDTVLVRGANDIGSAVAHRLHQAGFKVILHDDPAPAHLRRGMAFTDAFFTGSAELEGVTARLAASAAELAGQATGGLLVTGLPLSDVLGALRPGMVVDARMRKRAVPDDQQALAAISIGLGPGFEVGRNCSVAIETAWGESLGQIVRSGPTLALAGEPRLLGDAGRERFVYAPQAGLWRTTLDIGSSVEAGQIVGRLGDLPVAAPITGALRGLTHDGVTVRERQKIVEVDPRRPPDVYGLGVRPDAIARGVQAAIVRSP